MNCSDRSGHGLEDYAMAQYDVSVIQPLYNPLLSARPFNLILSFHFYLFPHVPLVPSIQLRQKHAGHITGSHRHRVREC